MQKERRLIISHLLGSEREIATFLFDSRFDDKLRASPEELLFASWELKPAQRILVAASLDLWGSHGNVFLWELLQCLDKKRFARLVEALDCWQGLTFPPLPPRGLSKGVVQ